jgi:hypothetical protein
MQQIRASFVVAAAALAVASSVASAQLRITEFMYDGNGGEFIEVTNTGATALDVTGWLLADNNRATTPVTALAAGNTRRNTTNPFSLSALGTIAPGESVLFTEADAATFRADWSLPTSIRILGGIGSFVDSGGSGTVADPTIRTTNGFNFGRSDEINIYTGAGMLVDRLTYNDQAATGLVRTQRVSGITLQSNWGANNFSGWFASTVGDIYGTYTSAQGDVGNPGVIPAPGAVAALGVLGLMAARRRR